MGEPVLTLQGKTESAVIIRRLRVIDVERRTPPSDAVVIFPDGGGGGVLAVRYFELNMSDPHRSYLGGELKIPMVIETLLLSFQ